MPDPSDPIVPPMAPPTSEQIRQALEAAQKVQAAQKELAESGGGSGVSNEVVDAEEVRKLTSPVEPDMSALLKDRLSGIIEDPLRFTADAEGPDPLPAEAHDRLAEMQADALKAAEGKTPAEALEELSAWLDSLVPDERTVTVIDVAGDAHEVLVLASAEKLIKVGRRIKTVLSKHTDGEMGFSSGNLTALLISLADDPDVLEAIEVAFGLLCRSAWRAARLGPAGEMATEELREDAELLGEEFVPPSGPLKPRQLYPLEEMISGVIPFSGRLIRRVLGLMAKPGTGLKTIVIDP